MMARLADQLVNRGPQRRRLLGRKNLLGANALLGKELNRHEQLPPCRIAR